MALIWVVNEALTTGNDSFNASRSIPNPTCAVRAFRAAARPVQHPNPHTRCSCNGRTALPVLPAAFMNSDISSLAWPSTLTAALRHTHEAYMLLCMWLVTWHHVLDTWRHHLCHRSFTDEVCAAQTPAAPSVSPRFPTAQQTSSPSRHAWTSCMHRPATPQWRRAFTFALIQHASTPVPSLLRRDDKTAESAESCDRQ